MVWEIEHYMPLEEFEDWIAWFKIKNEAQKKELQKTKQEYGKGSHTPRSRNPRRG